MKDKEWLKEQIKHEEVDLKYAFDNYVPYEKVLIADDVNELLNQLEEPEQEKVVVNEVMAGHIENCKNLKLTLSDSLHLVVPEDKQKEVLFARAWLDGYTVDKEKLYRVVLIKGKYLIYNRKNKQLHNQELDAYVGDYEQREFTEQEIKAIDERYWAFAEEITE